MSGPVFASNFVFHQSEARIAFHLYWPMRAPENRTAHKMTVESGARHLKRLRFLTFHAIDGELPAQLTCLLAHSLQLGQRGQPGTSAPPAVPLEHNPGHGSARTRTKTRQRRPFVGRRRPQRVRTATRRPAQVCLLLVHRKTEKDNLRNFKMATVVTTVKRSPVLSTCVSVDLECDPAYPIAYNNGDSCCKHFHRIFDPTSNANFDGGDLLRTDPEDACPKSDFVACQNTAGGKCIDHKDGHSELRRKLSKLGTIYQFSNWSLPSYFMKFDVVAHEGGPFGLALK